MRRLTWRNLLRTALLATGVSIGLGGIAGQRLCLTLAVAADEGGVATVEEAAKVLDLSSLPLPDAAKVPFARHLGGVTYEVDSDFKSAFQFHQKQLTKLGWKEVPGGVNAAQNVSVRFQNKGYTISVTAYPGSDPDKPKSAMVSITNLGNVPLDKLPVVKGAKKVYASEVTASYSSTMKVAEAVEATRKLLIDAGWEPYGSTGNPPESEVLMFKKNAVRMTAFVGVAPVQKGQVMISYSATLLSADIPAPANAKEISFDEAMKNLQFQSADSFDDVAKFYMQRLAKMGWTPKSKELSKTKYGDNRPLGELGFKNSAKDSLTLRLTQEDGLTKANLTLRTTADIAALEKELKVAQEKLAAEEKARKEAGEPAVAQTKPASKPSKKAAADSDDDDGFPNVDALIKDAVGDALKDAGLGGKKPAKANAADKDAVSVPIPEGAKKVTQTSGNVLQIKWAAGKGKASAEALRDQLLAAGWEAEDGDKIEKNSGNVTFTKDGKTLTLSFVDTGFADVNMMLIGIGVKLTEGKADPDAKVPVASSKPKSKSNDDAPSSEPLKALQKKIGRKPTKSDSDGDAPVADPARKAKPNRGIAKLDKLPNEGEVAVNNLATSLPHVVAFEAVSGGRWVTRVVASEKPIKQDMLIEWMKNRGKIEDLNFPASHVQLELDDQDRPNRLSMLVGQASLGASGGDLEGDAVVEDGRARGSFRMKMPKDVFGKQFLAEISFDVPVLTRDSQPAKQLADAKKLETSGKVVVDNQPKKLSHVIAYQVKSGDEVRTAVLFNEKPINVAKLKEALAKNGNDDGVIDFSSQVKVYIDKNDRPAFLNLYTDGVSLNQNTNLVGDVIVEDLRVRGTVKFDKPVEFFGKTIDFDLTFDLEVIPLPAKSE